MSGTSMLFGNVAFRAGQYVVMGGSRGWSVQPILGFKGSTAFFPPEGARLPLGQVEILFDAPIAVPYVVLISAEHNERLPLVSANWGRMAETGFVVHLWETVADRTLVNAGFSFLVLKP